jgi:hypothetical protein
VCEEGEGLYEGERLCEEERCCEVKEINATCLKMKI